MKNNLPSARFLHEFDTVDTVALRNISEKRKLRQQLGELDKQLHSNLVRMESEILSIRLENCENPLRGKAKPKEGKSKVSKGKTKTSLKGNARDEARNSSQKMESNLAYLNDGINANEGTQNTPHKTLPKITTSSYLVTKQQEQFGQDQQNETELLNESFSLETISELGQKQLQAEQRILLSLQHPHSKPKMQTGTNSRPPTPHASNQLLSPLKPIDRQRRASSHGLLAPLPDEYVTKGRLTRAFSAPDVSESLSMNKLQRLRRIPNRQNESYVSESLSTSEVGRLRSLPVTKRQNQIPPGEVNGTETVTNGIKICVTTENGSPMPERKAKFKLDSVKPREVGNPRSKKTDFDDVIRRRLQLLENGVPRKEDLERIRYLRLKDENKNTNEVEDIFAVLHQNKSG